MWNTILYVSDVHTIQYLLYASCVGIQNFASFPFSPIFFPFSHSQPWCLTALSPQMCCCPSVPPPHLHLRQGFLMPSSPQARLHNILFCFQRSSYAVIFHSAPPRWHGECTIHFCTVSDSPCLHHHNLSTHLMSQLKYTTWNDIIVGPYCLAY